MTIKIIIESEEDSYNTVFEADSEETFDSIVDTVVEALDIV